MSVTLPSPFEQASITPSSKVNGAVSNYVIKIQPACTHEANSKLAVEFPALIDPPLSPIKCTGLTATKLKEALMCEKSGRVLTITLELVAPLTQLTKDDIVEIQVDSIKNYISFLPVSGFVITSSNSLSQPIHKASVPAISNSVQGAITGITCKPNTYHYGASTYWEFTFTLQNSLPVFSMIEIVFPTSGFTLNH